MGNVEMVRPRDWVHAQIAAAIVDGENLSDITADDEAGLAALRDSYLAWESRTAALLESSFKASGFMTSNPRQEFSATAVSLLDLKLSSTRIPRERRPEVLTDIQEKLRVLRSVDGRLDIYETPNDERPGRATPPPNAPIFLVHGRDLLRRETVRRFLERVTKRDVVVLADQPNRGQDLLGKLLSHAQSAGFAVILLTPDDVGGLESGSMSPRARQNVVFELGLFIALLGRDRVAAINDPSVEIPTDFSGVAYIPMGGDSWQIELARELKAAGIEVSLDRAI